MSLRSPSRTVATVVVMLGRLSVVILSIALGAILSRMLEKTEYGTFRQLIFVYVTMAIVFEAGLPKATSALLPKVSLAEGRSLLTNILCLLFASGLAFSAVLYVGAESIGALLRNPDLPALLRIYAPMPALMLPSLALSGVCMANGRPLAIAVFEVLSKSAALFAVVTPIWLGYSLESAVRLWVMLSAFSTCLAIGIMFHPYRSCSRASCPYRIRELIGFGVPLVGASIAGVLLRGADRFVVSRFFGVEEFALYVNGAMEFPLIALVTGSVATVMLPSFAAAADDAEGKKEIASMWSRTLSKTAAILYPSAVFAFVYADDIMRLVYSEEYVASSLFFRIYLAVTLVRVIPYQPLMLGIGAVRSYMLGSVLGCGLAWAMAYSLCKCLGSSAGAAAAYVCAVYVIALFFIFDISRRQQMKISLLLPWRSILTYLVASSLAGLFACLCTLQISETTLYATCWRLLVAAAAFSGFYAISMRAFGLNVLSIVKPLLWRPSVPRATMDRG